MVGGGEMTYMPISFALAEHQGEPLHPDHFTVTPQDSPDSSRL
jgi:hypothetical protein